MGRRRKTSGISLERTQDPGKDLFAYLFLMIMVFSIMLLMTAEEGNNSVSGQVAPQKQENTGRSRLKAVSEQRLGRLTKKGEQIFLVFGEKAYDPRKDLDQLGKDGCISVFTDEDERKKKVIYLEEERTNQVFLGEYLIAFQYLSGQGINVAFAEKVR